jgi:hypothetical protein
MNKLLFLAITALIGTNTWAQKQKWYNYLSGSFETNTQLYKKDALTNAVFPPEKRGSHNFLKLDAQYKGFFASSQWEGYLPSLQGYVFTLNDNKIINTRVGYKAKKWGITLGDFYEQFGTGSLLRAFENRPIGINNAIRGGTIYLKPIEALTIKALHGTQRINFDQSEGKLWAADAEYQLINNTEKEQSLQVGASWVQRNQPYLGVLTTIPERTTAVGARLNYTTSKWNVQAEYAQKTYDPHVANFQNQNTGKLLWLNAAYSIPGLAVQAQVRRTENMDFRTDRNATATYLPINYIAPLTKPNDYSLANIYVYAPQLLGEAAMQLDIIKTFDEGTAWGGKYGSTLTINVNVANNLKINSATPVSYKASFLSAGQKYFSDASIYFKKKFSKKTTANFGYHNTYYNKEVLEGGFFPTIKSNILVAEGIFKIGKKQNIRAEIQHLSTKQDLKNWASAMVEYTFYNGYSVFVGDMYNYGNVKKIHYYNIGLTAAVKKNKLILNYARQRAGIVCVGGVCRFVPASTGLNISLVAAF